MMDNTIDEVIKYTRNRKSLLWVCQRYDLLPDTDPHDYCIAESEASILYRGYSNDTDIAISSLYWEAIWLEGAKSPLLPLLKNSAEGKYSEEKRQVVTLSSESDANAQFSTNEFLPVSVLPGIIDTKAPKDAIYGAVGHRKRTRIAWDLKERITTYQGRLLVVIGAQTKTDLFGLYEVLEDAPILDLHVLVVWPYDKEQCPSPPSNPAIRFHIWEGSTIELVETLKHRGAPLATELNKWDLRIGTSKLTLKPSDVKRINDRFILLTEKDLIQNQRFTIEDFFAFLAGDANNWVAFNFGLPIPRAYMTSKNQSLEETVITALKYLSDEACSQRSIVITLPCEGCSGATTSIRKAAFDAAVGGYPTLILKSDQTDIDIEDVLSFVNTLSEQSLNKGISLPAVLIVLDVEHSDIKTTKSLHQKLASQSRKVVILQAANCEENDIVENIGAKRITLKTLRALTTKEEVKQCAMILKEIVDNNALNIRIPEYSNWINYEQEMKWISPVGSISEKSLFWIALRFFITEEMDFSIKNEAMDYLGAWVRKRMARLDSSTMDFVKYIAALSSRRIVSPLYTVLRPFTGGVITSSVVKTIGELKDIVIWGEYSKDFDDQSLRFLHPVIAEEFLRQDNITSESDVIKTLYPVLTNLSQGHSGDIWIAELICSTTVPKHDERRNADWAWRLNMFENIPPLVRDNSKTVLHHWARCLYLSADTRNNEELPKDERIKRFEMAIQKLRKACDIPQRSGRDENPSNLYNTLGTALVRYAKFAEEYLNNNNLEEMLWKDACQSFDKAISLSVSTNIEALLAYIRTLTKHAIINEGEIPNEQFVQDIASALNLIDETERIISEFENPDEEWLLDLTSYKAEALSKLSRKECGEFIRALKNNNLEMGYYCEARLAIVEMTEDGYRKSLQIIDAAVSNNVQLGHRSLLLKILLLSKLVEQKYNYAAIYDVYTELEQKNKERNSPINAFRHAVICYQVGKYSEGEERFRKLREQFRRSGTVPLRTWDFLRDAVNPEQPKLTNIRITRLITEWRAVGFVEDLNQSVVLSPRHFDPQPKVNEIVPCVISFGHNGPIAVPKRFIRADRC